MIDIMALAGTASTVATTVGQVVDVVQGALDRRRGISREQVSDLSDQLSDLSEQVASIAVMGKVLDDYVHSLVRALETQAACDKLKDFVSANRDGLSHARDPLHDALWMLVDNLVQALTAAKAGNIQYILDRTEFLDRDDATAIRMLVDRFNTSYAAALAEKDARRPGPLIQSAEAMWDASGQMRQILEGTISNKMIRSLVAIGG